MAFKKDLCRNFQRGSCQYGERCKFIHATQQKPNNPLGFGSNDFTNKQQQSKPFENTWNRFTHLPGASGGAAASSRQADNQPSQSSNHKCTDLDSCKRQIAEDYQNEKPLWKLTCYGHSKNGPCDIVGDVSYEELRAAAYDEAKRGLSLQSIVERERNLFSSKLTEFETLLRNPYKAPPNSSLSLSPFPGAAANAVQHTAQNNPPPSVSSFSQLGASLNLASGTRPSTPPVFGQPTFPNSSQTPNPFETRPSTPPVFGQPTFPNTSQTPNPFGTRPNASLNNLFSQTNGFSNSSQPSNIFGITNLTPSYSNGATVSSQAPSMFGKSNLTPANLGSLRSEPPGQASSNLFSTNAAGFRNSSMISNQNNPFSAMSAQVTSPATAQHLPNSATNSIGQVVRPTQSVNDIQTRSVSADASIWSKESWARGEIPEDAPPDEYI